MFRFMKKIFFFTATVFFNFSGLNVDSLGCVSVNNQKYKIRSEIKNQ